MLLGWSMSQWAEAICWYRWSEKISPLPTLTHAQEIMNKWRHLRMDEPAQGKLILTKPVEKDTTWAADLMYRVAIECPLYNPKEETRAPSQITL